ncbi:helix-turn-helix domain-containing protein [Kribbella qitaiheensis]|uniref:Helix-turn-helix domain-containing protein n=1 Tax=Kribbella qitaiheensis TaxID=1544730 RepID=A0A7G6WWL6_9ACTN|nr:helix-turn-helix transcriptional regulator [Kribbella qitaiheensis]QNE18381.1 helix-turn-helix domain-containing protein [Kribbella qitaiheensis]QNE19181.1 helix-turn-helix domain-containing protein [Kribbella qitaiheensis]
MGSSFGETLRSVRSSRDLSLRGLARLVYFSPAFIGHVETGLRQPTEAFAQAVDQALETSGLFTELARLGDDDEVYRRTLLKALGTLTSVGAIAPSAVAETLRHSLDRAASLVTDADDWESIVSTYGRGFMTEPLSELSQRAMGDLLVLSANPHLRGRHGVRLAMVYGSSVASLGDPVTAKRWYNTAVKLADHSGDRDMRAWSRARLAYRVFYEGGEDKEVLQSADYPITFGGPASALIEAHAAKAHVFASQGDSRSANQALGSAYRSLELAQDQDGSSIFAMPGWRLAIAASWTYTALGDIAKAQAIQAEAEKLPKAAIRWRAQLDMHRAWGVVQSEDIDTGAGQARQLLETERSKVIHGLGQRVYLAVPPSERDRTSVRDLAEALKVR